MVRVHNVDDVNDVNMVIGTQGRHAVDSTLYTIVILTVWKI